MFARSFLRNGSPPESQRSWNFGIVDDSLLISSNVMSPLRLSSNQ